MRRLIHELAAAALDNFMREETLFEADRADLAKIRDAHRRAADPQNGPLTPDTPDDWCDRHQLRIVGRLPGDTSATYRPACEACLRQTQPHEGKLP